MLNADLLEDFGAWLLDHPRAARALGLAIVAAGTLAYLKTLRAFVEMEHVLAVHAGEVAREASEALGG